MIPEVLPLAKLQDINDSLPVHATGWSPRSSFYSGVCPPFECPYRPTASRELHRRVGQERDSRFPVSSGRTGLLRLTILAWILLPQSSKKSSPRKSIPIWYRRVVRQIVREPHTRRTAFECCARCRKRQDGQKIEKHVPHGSA